MEVEKTEEQTPNPIKEKLSQLKLRRILTENHDLDIKQVIQNTCNENYYNLCATVGGNQVNVYDNLAAGNNLNLCYHFELNESEDSRGGEVSSCCWINGEDDALLAVGTTNGEIHIISLRNTQVIKILTHVDYIDIVHLTNCNEYPSILISQMGDGSIFIWDYIQSKIIYEIKSKKIVSTAISTKEEIPTIYLFTAKESFKLPLPSFDYYINNDISLIPVPLPSQFSSLVLWTQYNSKYNKMILLTTTCKLFIYDPDHVEDCVTTNIADMIVPTSNTIGFSLTTNQDYVFVGGSEKITLVNMKGEIVYTTAGPSIKKQDYIGGYIDGDMNYMILCFGVTLLRYTYIDPKIRFVTRIKHSYPVEDILLFYDSYDSVPQFVLQPVTLLQRF